MCEKNIEYKRMDEEPINEDTFEDILELLYEYLSQFISKEALEEDLRYCFNKGRVIGAYQGRELIGAIAGVQIPFFDKFHIAHIAVEKKFQGKGIGKKLTKKVIPPETGASVHLNTDNPEIEKFYQTLGFQATHKRFKKPAKEDSDFKPSD
ncbi:MAG: GNAT family N-acetyltransferase [Candidatus Thermoplasmatota archaeon]|nr:GNAT family N-acetyltransferase [Candidatus Thermoplasmatota archaeon]MBS3790262.1 GNAT family N-acetyltransferase [Candidatus Thermoplasmatota archaeon]